LLWHILKENEVIHMNVKVAYFSAEFGLDESLPIYSGGLGVLAGDHVKAANDLGIPLVGVGIFYRKGYFEQQIQQDGTQAAFYPKLNIRQLPIKPVFNAQGERLVVSVPIAGESIYLQVWAAEIGNVSVYLLDADFDLNQEPHRRLTEHLYGGDKAYRISQEIILGIGGVRVLRALGIEPQVWHMNEGHSAFLVLERIREYSAQGVSFAAALEAVRASTLFTTHTPVPAGHDVFTLELMDQFLGDFYWQLGADRRAVIDLGRVEDQGFNMTRLALRTSSKVNGVSKLHAEVSKLLFHQWTPEIPECDFPVDAVTNGVHTPTWLSQFLMNLYDRFLVKDWRLRIADPAIWRDVQAIPDDELWNAHQLAKQRMAWDLHLPDLSNTLVVGFARRFATYKRALLLFQDVERLKRLVTSSDRPVCFIFAGKAHPADLPGQQLIRQIFEYSRQEPFRGRIFLVENYQMGIAKRLVQGVDVWLNTPVKPMEASGTSGQKAGLNGVLNCSVLDGWWAEGFNGKNGWAVAGATDGVVDAQERDLLDSEDLYRLLEEQIVSLYYQRDLGIPRKWIAMMKESIVSLTPVYSTHRMVAEYARRMYDPLASRGQRFTVHDMEVARRVADYKQFIRDNWHLVQFDSVKLIQQGEQLTVSANIRFGPIWHRDLLVEIIGSDGQDGVQIVRMKYQGEGANKIHTYAGVFPGTMETWQRSKSNIRVIPISPDFSSRSEMELIRWWKN
jgi:glycogen phosphorylase